MWHHAEHWFCQSAIFVSFGNFLQQLSFVKLSANKGYRFCPYAAKLLQSYLDHVTSFLEKDHPKKATGKHTTHYKIQQEEEQKKEKTILYDLVTPLISKLLRKAISFVTKRPENWRNEFLQLVYGLPYSLRVVVYLICVKCFAAYGTTTTCLSSVLQFLLRVKPILKTGLTSWSPISWCLLFSLSHQIKSRMHLGIHITWIGFLF